MILQKTVFQLVKGRLLRDKRASFEWRFAAYWMAVGAATRSCRTPAA